MADDDRPFPADAAVAERVRAVHERVVTTTTSEALALVELLGSTRRLAWVNFVAGLARGLGLFLGVSIVGAVLVGVSAFVFDKAFATLGLKDITLKSTVTSAYQKYVEIQDLIADAQKKVDTAKREMQALPSPTDAPTSEP